MAPGAVSNKEPTALAIAELLDPRPWYKNGRLLALNAWIFLLLITSYTNGYDGSMMNGLQILDQWKGAMGNPAGGKLGLLNAIQNIGALCATPIAPYVTDGIGRKLAIIWGASLMIIGTAVQSAAQSVGMFTGARFLIGFGLTFAANAAPLLVSELAYPPHRAPLVSTYNSLWYSGSIVAAWTTFGTFRISTEWAWRIPSILQGLPSVLQVCLIWFCPESPRWLVSRGKHEKALNILAYYHGRGNEQDPLVQFEYNEIKEAIALDKEIAKNVGWLTLFSTPGNRRRMRIIIAIAFFSQWSGNGLVSYYLNLVFSAIGITSQTDQTLINGILQIFNLIVALIASFLCDRAGRRVLFLTSNVGMLLFYVMQTICFAQNSITGSQAAGHGVIAFIFLFYLAYDIAYTPLIVSYTVEILPYALRAKGFTIFNFTISLALIFNQYANPIAMDAIGWKYYVVYDCVLAFEIVFMFFYCVETKNRTLEETAALFDGEDKVDTIAARAGTQAGVDAALGRHPADNKQDEEYDEKHEHEHV
ncbi:hexose transporter [Dacryopinax primogenitus]|uniref:Hexose transporter n=1 Tax=Dacryopinax primogenitus (strain DJM 731) TaxID=1858805 RepID=M5G4V8_DACPD|nr:hexose transporter [Dacryopinax primogenitus]EJU00892.1 hexose transporter [Dacryopinax primogenitus]